MVSSLDFLSFGDLAIAPAHQRKRARSPFFVILAQARIRVDLSVAISRYNPSRCQIAVVSDAWFSV
ncbi:MAG: hypothetical protein JWO70_3303 [Betaproteobacteria bacterium]|nr:hypothetical protein [Betaproteobacteria bacterium]